MQRPREEVPALAVTLSAPEPPATRHSRRRQPAPTPSLALTGLFVLACLYTIAIARPVLQPLAIAFLLYFLVAPLVRWLEATRVPRVVAAPVVVLGFLLVIGLGAYHLARPAAHWMGQAPESIRQLQVRARAVAARFENVTRTAQQVEQMTEVGTGDTPQVQIKEPGLGATMFGGLQAALADALVIFTMLLFLLVSGDVFLRKLLTFSRRTRDTRAAQDIARELERQVSSYLVVSTLINAAFGTAVGLAMWAIGLPNPLLWGVVAGLTNFVPYLGGAACMVALALASLLTFPDWGRALLVPGVFFVLNTIEGYFVTPFIMGRKLTVNTPVLFMGLLFWWWVWGVAGALLAVPLMATLKIVADRTPSLTRLGAFLGDEPDPESA